MASRIEIEMDINADGADPEETAELTRQLRDELLRLDIDTAQPPPGPPAPAGTRAVDPLAVGALVVSLVNASGLLAAVVGAVQNWLGGASGPRSVKLVIDGDSLEVTNVSSTEQRRLVSLWLRRRTAG
jgi:hypothetical protein